MTAVAELISIGSELTSGKNLDTNSQWLSVELSKIGIPVQFHTTVGDHLERNVAAIRAAVERSDLVVITGGLGPTQDDLTREAMAAVAGVRLEFHAPSFEAIQAMFSRRNRVMPDRNRVQALFPAGSEPIPNAHGTAPGIWMLVARRDAARGAVVVAMPGVPSEMFHMFADQVRPRLVEAFGLEHVIVHRKINAFGMGESDVESRLLDVTERGRQPEVGITVHDATISLRIAASARSESEAVAQIEPTARIIYERLGSLIFSEGDVELQQVVAGLLEQRHLTLATAEGCTGGCVAERLVSIAGASGWFRGGIVAYSDEAKFRLLDVPRQLIERHGAVSSEVAAAMAEAARRLFASDLAVSTVGIAGPGGTSDRKPAGTFAVAVASDQGTTARMLNVWGDRAAIQSRGTKHALNQVRLWLQRPSPAQV